MVVILTSLAFEVSKMVIVCDTNANEFSHDENPNKTESKTCPS